MIGPQIRRVYYSSTEICRMAGITRNRLRSWEKKFSELSPAKIKSGRNCYKPDQLTLLKRINEFKRAGYTDDKIHQMLGDPQLKHTLTGPSGNLPRILLEIKNGLHEILELTSERFFNEI